MGWATGSYIAEKLWKDIKPYLEKDDYKNVSNILIQTFCSYDADDWTFEDNDMDNLLFVYLKYNKPNRLKQYRRDKY